MSEKVFFSIIIPVYNTEKFLRRCIDSVLNQIYSNFEIIVVNDCSPGNCTEIIESYTDGRIQYINKNKNEGTHLARKSAVLKAESEYCLFLDSDDYYKKNALEILHRYLTSNPVDLLEFGYKVIPHNNAGNFIYLENKICFLDRILTGELVYYDHGLCNKSVKTMILKSAFSKMKDFYCIWFEDGYEQFIISSHCKSFDAIKKYLLILDCTSGITSCNYELTYEKFSVLVNNVVMVTSALDDYIREENLMKYKPILIHAFDLHSSGLMYNFFPLLKNEDKIRGIKLMLESFQETTCVNFFNELLSRERINSKICRKGIKIMKAIKKCVWPK